MEALGHISKDRDRLLNEYNDLKAKLNHDYDEQAEQKRSYHQEVDSLLKLSSKIKEYVLLNLAIVVWTQYLCFNLQTAVLGTMISRKEIG